MDLLVVRHGIAMDRDEALERAFSDRDRPLTDKGRARMGQIAKNLAKLAPGIRAIFTSDLSRATETADIVAKEYGKPPCTRTPALLPEADPDEISRVLGETEADSFVALVGHEPHLSRFVTWCLTGKTAPVLELKKGGACLLRFETAVGPSQGRLIWLAPPAVLRHI